MAPKVRDRIINAIIMTGSGSAVAVLAFWLQTSDIKATDLKKNIDSKLDKTEFVKYKDKNEADHKEIKLEIKTEFKEDLEAMEKRLNRESDIRDKNLREFIKVVVDK
jgi:hypothetical protein